MLTGVPGGNDDAGAEHDENEGNGDLRFLMRFKNADFASPHPLGKPVGKQSQILHSASLAA
ncbi:MAG: hypothetical protein ACRC8O_08615 [Plesiomonas shigelloides]